MGVVPSIPEQREALKAYRRQRYEAIRTRQQHGATGGQIVASLTDLADEIIDRLYRQTLQAATPDTRWRLEDGLAIVALGGYGRGELAPFSDLDLMFLYRETSRRVAEIVAADILQVLWDIGYRVGHSLRTVEDCLSIGEKDLTVHTSLMEARFLAGDQRLFDLFRTRFHRKVILRQPRTYVKAKLRDRLAECQQYGTTVYLLEPDVKMSQGGLRDLHLLRWGALCIYDTASLETLKHRGMLSARDYTALTDAQEFLWLIRNAMHFGAGRSQDRLTFEEQIRLARLWEFQDGDHLLGVERFMRQYYEQTTAILDLSRSLLERMTAGTFLQQVKKYMRRHMIDGRFLVEGDEISIAAEGRSAVLSRPAELLRLFHLAQTRRLRLSSSTQDLIKHAQASAPLISRLDTEAATVFLGILGEQGRAGWVLRELHRLRLLEQVIPAFAPARGLMQFNAYHTYTVDEHCLRAVEEAEALLQGSGTVVQVYREIIRKDVLHLALLLHDVGKGQGPDHSMVGAQIAEQAAERLSLDPTARGLLVFLIRYHLLMTRVAFRRDLSDETVLVQFAKTVATPEALRMLYVLTVADVAAVGPGTLTAWKQDLLEELLENTLEILTGERPAQEDRVAQVRAWVLAHAEPGNPDWVARQVASMPTRYLLTTPGERIVRHLGQVRRLPAEQVLVDPEYDAVRQTTEYTVYTTDAPGIFYKIAGVLAAHGLQILGANIITWDNGTVVDTFQVQDPDFTGAPSRARLEQVSRAIQDVLQGRASVEELVARGRRIEPQRPGVPMAVPTQVEVDNASSEPFTILEVFAQDRQGLLFVIAKAMFELGLSVHAAKVATQVDQIVDVFYVTHHAGQKLLDRQVIHAVKQRLAEAIADAIGGVHLAHGAPQPADLRAGKGNF